MGKPQWSMRRRWYNTKQLGQQLFWYYIAQFYDNMTPKSTIAMELQSNYMEVVSWNGGNPQSSSILDWGFP